MSGQGLSARPDLEQNIHVAGEFITVHVSPRPDFPDQVHVFFSRGGFEEDRLTRAEALAAARKLVEILEGNQ